MTTPIAIFPYSQALSTPYRWSKGTQHRRGGLLVRVEIDGNVGWGEAALPPHVDYDTAIMATQCRALIEGLDPLAPDFLARLDEREPSARLRCGISTALHSALAACEGKSLSAYLAGDGASPASEVPINELVTDEEPKACVQRVGEALARGQNMVKVKCTQERELDIARIGAIRDAFPDIGIRLDPNESWSPDWALGQLRAMAQFNIDYCEEPLPRGTPMSFYTRLCAESPVPIALDDSVRTPFHAECIITLGAAHVFILKAQRLGGPDVTARIINMARQAGLRCVVTASLESAIGLHLALHCAALLPQPIEPCGLGTARFFASDVGDPPPIVDGAMFVPETPGLGVEPYPRALETAA
ncbi:MAG: hypothetical protein K5872_13605 [Rhizobiaceae bacterium]|nr:hypothetical protein [Rhizobiaceae bacterium]MCV0407256.1 hypothetical protein [Rhizobiaceae bacterium]